MRRFFLLAIGSGLGFLVAVGGCDDSADDGDGAAGEPNGGAAGNSSGAGGAGEAGGANGGSANSAGTGGTSGAGTGGTGATETGGASGAAGAPVGGGGGTADGGMGGDAGGGECVPGARRCAAGSAETCNAGRVWDPADDCEFACEAGACVTACSFPQDATGREAAYRLEKSGDTLVVHFYSLEDPNINANDAVYFGYTVGGTITRLVRVHLPPGGEEPLVPAIFRVWARSAGTWTGPDSSLPDWLSEPEALRSPGAFAAEAGVVWSMRFEVDLAGVQAGQRIFLGTHVTLATGSIDYYVPDYPGGTTLLADTIVPEASDTNVWRAVSELDPACAVGF
jgi:hypothetical protein